MKSRPLFPLSLLFATTVAFLAPRTEDEVFGVELEALDGWLVELLETERAVGVAALIGRGDEIVYQRAFGELEEGGTELQTDAIFRIYSMSKPITSVAALMLVEEGKLSLDDPVAKFAPAFAEQEVALFPPGATSLEDAEFVPAKSPMTVRHLLSHTSGLIYGFFSKGPLADLYAESRLWGESVDLEEFCERVGALPLAFQPGEGWQYSVSTDVLGYVVQEASGKPFAEFLEERIFEPLGMRDTGFFVPEEKVARFSQLYYQASGKIVKQDDEGRAAYLSMPVMPSGGAGLVSTLDDYGRFCALLVNGGELDGVRLLEEETVLCMATPERDSPAATAFGPGMGFGLGFLVVRDGASIGAPLRTSQMSWGGMASTEFFVNPDQRLFGVFMTQVMPSSGTFKVGFEREVYRALGVAREVETGR